MIYPLGGLPPKARNPLFASLISYYLSPSQFHLELLTDRQDDSNVHGIVDGQNLLYIRYVRYFSYVEFFLTHGLRSTICTYMYDMYICTRLSSRARDSPDARTTPRSHHASTTPRSHHTTRSHHTCTPLTPHCLSIRRTQQPTRRRRWRRVTMMVTTTTTTMATGDDNDDGDGQPFAPHERFLGLLARDSSRETPRETPCKRLLARDSSQESSWGGQRTQQPTMNGRRDGIR